MSSDLSLTPKAGLIALLNAKSSVVVTENDLLEIFPPVALQGTPNTEVTVKTTLAFSHAGRVTRQYNRLNLASLTPYQLSATVGDSGTLAEYLTMLTTRYGIYLTPDDFLPNTTFDVSGGELSYTLNFTAHPNNLRWYGTGAFIVNIVWNLADPELVEQQVNRLRTLINVTLPLSLSTFMQSA
jgi:hypothetical protein